MTVRLRCRTRQTWMIPSTMGELVEPLGFDSLWVGEHFGTPYSMWPDAMQSLAFWAGRTTRIDFGHVALVVLPWHHPGGGRQDRDARHFAEGPAPPPGDWPRHRASRVRLARLPDCAVAQVLLRGGQGPSGRRTVPSASPSRGRSTRSHRPPSVHRPATRANSPGGSRRLSPPRPQPNWRPRTAWGKCSSPVTTSTR